MKNKFFQCNFGHVVVIVTLVFNIGMSYQKLEGLGTALKEMKEANATQADKTNSMEARLASVETALKLEGKRLRSPKDSE